MQETQGAREMAAVHQLVESADKLDVALVDREAVVDAFVAYVEAQAYADATADRAMACEGTPEYLDASRLEVEATEVARGYLHALAMTLYPEPTGLAHEPLVDRVDDAFREGYQAGFGGHTLQLVPDAFDVDVETIDLTGDLL